MQGELYLGGVLLLKSPFVVEECPLGRGDVDDVVISAGIVVGAALGQRDKAAISIGSIAANRKGGGVLHVVVVNRGGGRVRCGAEVGAAGVQVSGQGPCGLVFAVHWTLSERCGSGCPNFCRVSGSRGAVQTREVLVEVVGWVAARRVAREPTRRAGAARRVGRRMGAT